MGTVAVQWRCSGGHPQFQKLGGTLSALLSHAISSLSTNALIYITLYVPLGHTIIEGQSGYVHIIIHYIDLGGMLCLIVTL